MSDCSEKGIKRAFEQWSKQLQSQRPEGWGFYDIFCYHKSIPKKLIAFEYALTYGLEYLETALPQEVYHKQVTNNQLRQMRAKALGLQVSLITN
jgi:hypothetical protein